LRLYISKSYITNGRFTDNGNNKCVLIRKQEMGLKLAIILAFSTLFSVSLYGQSDTYVVTRTTFSSDRYDEFSPAYYNNGLVFCTNRNPNQIKKYTDSQNRGFLKIFYIDTTTNVNWVDAKLFSKKLTSNLNDGPATFSANGVTVYFSRNIITDGKMREISSPKNTLGIFYSTFDGSDWKEPHEFRFNNDWHNITTPCLSPDGMKLFFSSDMEGGYGGSDIYFCLKKNDYWGDAVNLGPAINTPGNEAYPFCIGGGELLFSSDGHPGLGGKDVFFSCLVDSVWLGPVHIDSPINSKYDDFGMVTDPLMRGGYFSSNRNGTFDIFKFTTIHPQIFYCPPQRLNQYCFKIKDGKGFDFDPNVMKYEWEFGDSKREAGEEVEHCFPGPGKFLVRQYVIDKATDTRIFLKESFELNLKEIEQPFITAPDLAIAGEALALNGLESHFTDSEISSYLWDFGDGARSAGSTVSHSYSVPDDYTVCLSLQLKNKNSGDVFKSAVSKSIKIFGSSREMDSFIASSGRAQEVYSDLTDCKQATIITLYHAKNEFVKNAVYQIEILNSKTKVLSINAVFKKIKEKYFIKEVLQTDGSYSYVVAEETEFINSFLVYKDVVSFGYSDAVIKTRVFTSPEEKELNNLKRVYGDYADLFFGKYDARISSGGYAFLDQIFILLDKYPGCRLYIESHTDRGGTSAMNIELSQQRAKAFMNYLVNRGIDVRRLIAAGRGDLRPLALNNSEEEKKKNQRLEMMIIK